jgi:hypothetical protein
MYVALCSWQQCDSYALAAGGLYQLAGVLLMMAAIEHQVSAITCMVASACETGDGEHQALDHV